MASSAVHDRSSLDPTSPTLLVAEAVYDGLIDAPDGDDEFFPGHPVPTDWQTSPAQTTPAPHTTVALNEAVRDERRPELLIAVPVVDNEASLNPRSVTEGKTAASQTPRIDEPHRTNGAATQKIALPKIDLARRADDRDPSQAALFPGLGSWLYHTRRSLIAGFISMLVHTIGLVVLGLFVDRAQKTVVEPPPPLEVTVAPQRVLTKPEEPVVVAIAAEKPSIRSDGRDHGSSSGSAGAHGGKGGGLIGGLTLDTSLKVVQNSGSGGTGFGTEGAYGNDMLGEVGEVKTEATFFGVKATGRKFVFVVDTSGSMFQNNRYMRCREELIRSLSGLGYGQQYFVVFFNSNTFPMPERRLMDAKAPQLKKTITWIHGSLPMGLTEPWDGLTMGLRMKPDAIYLLTDGEFSPDVLQKVVAAQPGSKKIPIHTIAFESIAGEQTLQTISRVTGGKYQYVP